MGHSIPSEFETAQAAGVDTTDTLPFPQRKQRSRPLHQAKMHRKDEIRTGIDLGFFSKKGIEHITLTLILI